MVFLKDAGSASAVFSIDEIKEQRDEAEEGGGRGREERDALRLFTSYWGISRCSNWLPHNPSPISPRLQMDFHTGQVCVVPGFCFGCLFVEHLKTDLMRLRLAGSRCQFISRIHPSCVGLQ